MSAFSRIRSKSKSTINAWLVSAVIIIITLFFVYYFLIYVKKQEQLYTAEGFRVLTKIGENIDNRDRSYTTLLGNLEILKTTKNAPREQTLFLDSLYTGEERKGEIKFSLTDLNKRISKLTFGLELEEGKGGKKNYYYLSGFNKTIIRGEEVTETGSSKTLAIAIPTKTFFGPLERKDIFDEFIVWDDTAKQKIIYQSFRGDIESSSLNFTHDKTQNILSGRMYDVQINDIDYKLFLSHVVLHNKKNLYLGGLTETGNFMKKVRNIDPLFATSLVIFFLILLSALPIFKLKLLNEYSDLKLSDLAFSIMGLFLLTFLLVLVINISYQHAAAYKKLTNSLETLSDKISQNFQKELSSMAESLAELKSDEKSNPETEKSFGYKYYKTLFTMDTTGQQIQVWSNRLEPLTKNDLYYRNYFKQSGEWELAPGKKVMIESIKSNTSGENLGVVSIRRGNMVRAVTSRMYSVINTILPDGYSFYIITKNGDIWFSSDESKILQENLLEETLYDNDLREAIYRNERVDFSVRYHGKKHSAIASQISTLPLHLVVLYDNTGMNASSMIVISFTSFMILMTIIIFIITILLARITKYKHVFLRRPIRQLEMIIPDFNNRDYYIQSTVFNISASLAVIFFSFIYESCFGFIVQLIITSLIFMALVKKDSSKYAAYINAALLVILVTILGYNDRNIIENIIFQIILIIISVIIFYVYPKMIGNRKTIENKNLKSYHAYIYSWIFILVLLPTIIFFVKSYNHEAKLNAANSLFSYALDKSAKDYEIDKFTEEYCTPASRSSFLQLKNKGNYFDLANGNDNKKNNIQDSESPLFSDLFAQFSGRIRPAEISKYYFSSLKNSGDPLSTYSRDNTLYLRYRVPQEYRPANDSGEIIEAKITFYKYGGIMLYDPLISLLFIITSLIGIFFIYFLTKFLVGRYFGTEFFEEKQLEGMKKDFDNFVKKHIDAGLNIIIEKPFKDREVDYANKVKRIDSIGLIIESESKDKSEEKCLFYNFKIDINSPENDLKILSAVCVVAKKENQMIVLECPCSFERFIDDYVDSLNSINKNEKVNGEIKELYDNILNKLEEINYTFVHLIPPLLDDSLAKCSYKEADEYETHDFAKQEIKYLPHCKNILPVIKEYVDKLINSPEKKYYKKEIIQEKVIRKIYKLSSQFYSMLLSSCSKKEILLLHDIADDALINDQRKSILAVLLKKGLIEYQGHYRIMNESFRNFILTKFESETGQEYLENQRVTGKWHVYRLPVILVLVALAFFLAFQESIMSNLTTVLTSIVAAMGIIGKFSGLFSSTGNLIPKNNS